MQRRDFIRKAAGTAAGVAAVGAVSAPAIAQSKIAWKMQTTWARNSPLLWTGPQLVADFIEKASGGRMTVQIFASGELAPPFETLDAVADGAVEMGHGYPAYWAGKLMAINFFAPVPFFLTTQEQNAWFKWGGGQELADKVYGELGVKVFPSGNTSVQSAGWFTKELNSLADFKGLKVRSGGLGAKALAAVGATPVQLPLGEVPQALQTGAIDGCDFVGPFNDMAFGLQKSAKYYYWPGWMEPCGMLDCFINQAAWEDLPDDLKAIVTLANEYANSVVLSEFVAKNAQAIGQLQASGTEVKVFSDEILTALGQAASEVVLTTADSDPLAKEVFDSLLAFRQMVMPYTELSEMRFMQARSLVPNFGVKA